MANIINVDNVTSAPTPPPEMNPQTAGQWHNWGLYNHYLMVKALNGGDSVDAYRKYTVEQTQKLVDMGMVPQAGVDSVNRIFDVLQNASESGGFDTVIAQLQEVYAGINANESLHNTAVTSIANIAYNSARFWSEVTVTTTALRIDWKFWIKVICSDIGGAIGGSGLGPGGVIIGGIAGSVAGGL